MQIDLSGIIGLSQHFQRSGELVGRGVKQGRRARVNSIWSCSFGTHRKGKVD
jgi:hypothetical protein